MEFDVTLREGLTLVFLAIGCFFVGVAALGILRMPDLFLRMSMTTKASTLGLGSMLIASIIYFWGDTGVVARMLATIFFIFLTSPVSAHMIGRAGYVDKDTKLWDGTVIDDLKGVYKDRNIRTRESFTEERNASTVDMSSLE